MSRPKLYFVILIIAAVVGVFWYKQYQFYRTPVSNVANDGVLIVTGHPVVGAIPAINEPEFESVSKADQYLDDSGLGLMVEVNGQYRFYPYQILVWHQVVNDTFDGQNLLVSFCPLSFSGIVFEREMNLEEVEFGVSGKLWNSNMLMYDRGSESLWSQMLGTAVEGELSGAELQVYRSLVVSWFDFKEIYPLAEVLSRNTGFDRDYTQDPYELENYYESSAIWFPLSHEDERLSAKEMVFGYRFNGSNKTYSEDLLETTGLTNDQVGDRPVLIAWDSNLNTARAFSRQVGQEVLTFTQGDDFLIDEETGSLWNYEGECVSGKYWGEQLEILSLTNSFWFSWATFFPETELFK